MLTDAHCHPFDLQAYFPGAEEERRRLGVMCAASASTLEEFEYCEGLVNNVPLLPCFGVHPQQLSMNNEQFTMTEVLDELASGGRLAAVGETGFDLFNASFRESEKAQDEVFAVHLEIALRYELPLVIHVRRAMHKIFAHAGMLKKCRAVVFHSWPGTMGEGQALLGRGINAFFSFGTTIMLNHRRAMQCCALLPAERLLAETDAPYQPLRGRDFSGYADLMEIIRTIEVLRGQTEMENIIEKNFQSVFGT